MAKMYHVNRINQVSGFVGKHTNRPIDNFGPWTNKKRALDYMRQEFDYCVRFMEEKGLDWKIDDYTENHCKLSVRGCKFEYFEFYLLELAH